MIARLVLCLLSLGLSGLAGAQEGLPGRNGSTVAEAIAVMDFSGEPLVKAVGNPTTGVAFQSFKAEGKPAAIAKTIDKKLIKHGLKQLEGSSFSDEYCSASYQEAGYHFTMMVSPAGEPNVVMVSLMNLGNVDLSKLPKPTGMKQVSVRPASAM